MAQDAYSFANIRSYPRVSGIQIVLEFRRFTFLFGTSYVVLFNGLMILRISVPYVYCLCKLAISINADPAITKVHSVQFKTLYHTCLYLEWV